MTNIIRNKRGVTLIELLAVVVILGIIAAIAIPTIGGLIERQRINAAEATYITIVEQSRLYAVSEGKNDFTLQNLIDDDYITNLDFDVTNGNAEHISISVVGSTVTVSIVSPATAISFNDRNMVLSASVLTGEAE